MAISEEIQLSFAWRGITLAGSLHLPRGAGPHAAVLMAQGSGPADRDSGGYFEPIRQAFLDQGVATFAFDKPGCGSSTGDWRHYGLAGRAQQAVAALEMLRDHAAVRADQVGVWGHSQGGWLAQMLASQPIELAFAIASSAPTMGVAEQILYDIEHSMRDTDCGEEAVEAALELTRKLHSEAASDADFESISRTLLDPARHESWYGDFPAIEDADDWAHVLVLIKEDVDPVQMMSRISCPFLAVYGGLDSLLPPWRGAKETGQALQKAGNVHATVVAFPLGNHRLQKPGEENFVDGYLPLICDWISSSLVSTPTPLSGGNR